MKLLTFLGAGQYYRTTYLWQGQEFTSNFSPVASHHFLQPDLIILDVLKMDEANLPPKGRFFEGMPLQQFREQLLNRMDGDEIERDDPKGHEIQIAGRGQEMIRHLMEPDNSLYPLYQALIQRGKDVIPDLIQEWQAKFKNKQVNCNG
jgi:hypothetical protein